MKFRQLYTIKEIVEMEEAERLREKKKKIHEDLKDKVDELVIHSLQEYYELCSKPNKVDCSDDVIEPDEDLLSAIDRVLAEYMIPDSYHEWRKEKNT